MSSDALNSPWIATLTATRLGSYATLCTLHFKKALSLGSGLAMEALNTKSTTHNLKVEISFTSFQCRQCNPVPDMEAMVTTPKQDIGIFD